MDKFNMLVGSSLIATSEAMQKIDHNAKGILFLTDERGVLAGCVTDGDIRRFLLAGGKMSDNIMQAANCKPKFAYTQSEAKLMYHEQNYIAIPVIDEQGRMIDVYTRDKQKS